MQRPPRSMERGGLFDPLSRRLGSTPCVGGPNVGRWKFHFGFGDLFSEKHCPMRASPFAFRQRATSPGTSQINVIVTFNEWTTLGVGDAVEAVSYTHLDLHFLIYKKRVIFVLAGPRAAIEKHGK